VIVFVPEDVVRSGWRRRRWRQGNRSSAVQFAGVDPRIGVLVFAWFQVKFAARATLGVPTARSAAATIKDARENRGRDFELFI
jgi:hypothetical protein